MRPTRFVVALLCSVAASLAVACQPYNMEGVTPQTIVALETKKDYPGVTSPILLIVQDRSGSMNGCFSNLPAGDGEGCGADGDGDGELDTAQPSRMDVAQRVMREVVGKHLGDVIYGLTVYGSGALCGAPSSLVAVDSVETGAAVRAAYASDPELERPSGGTPTTLALRSAWEQLVDPATLRPRDDTRPNFVVLITDGMMNCNPDHAFPCVCSQEQGCGGVAYGDEIEGGVTPELCLDDEPSIAEVSKLRAAGVNTFVIGLGSNLTDQALAIGVLNRLAEEGGVPRADPADPGRRFYPADDQVNLAAALEEIIKDIAAPCEYDLDGPVCEGRLVAIDLTIDGSPVPTSCDPSLGSAAWYYVAGDPRKITFSQDLCRRLGAAEELVSISIRGVETACEEDVGGLSVGPACDLTQLTP